MTKHHQAIAQLLRTPFNQTKFLAEEVGYLALRIPGLDEVELLAIPMLACLAAEGEADVRRLASAMDLDVTAVAEHIDALIEQGFVESSANGFIPTTRGLEATLAIGKTMAVRMCLEHTGALAEVDRLRSNLQSEVNPASVA